MNEKIIERALKAIVNWNQQNLEFDEKFLELQDNFDLNIEKKGRVYTIKTKIKDD